MAGVIRDQVMYFDDSATDTTHANRPTLDVRGTFKGTAANSLDPVFGPMTDFDYFQIDIKDGIWDGDGSVESGSQLVVHFEPADAYFYRVGGRYDSIANLDFETDGTPKLYYSGSNALFVRHEPGIHTQGPQSVLKARMHFAVSTAETDLKTGNEVYEFQIVAGSEPGGAGPLDYTLSFSGYVLPKGPIPNFADYGAGKNNITDLHTSGASLWIEGRKGNDVLWSGQMADRVHGGAGRDIVIGDRGDDTLYGDDTATSAGLADQLLGGYGNDTAYGAAGNDYINGEWDDDTLFGGVGNDLIFGGLGADILDGGTGNDLLFGSATTLVNGDWFGPPILVDFSGTTGQSSTPTFWTITGEVQDDDAGADILNGGAGNDLLDGGLGADIMTGGAGNDTYIVDNAADQVIELKKSGVDQVHSALDYSLEGTFVENLFLFGDASSATGNAFANTITANAVSNVLAGGLGKDKFVFKDAPGPANIDTITDFSVKDDTILLDDAAFTAFTKTGKLASTAFAIGPEAADGFDRVIYDSGSGALYYDPDGTGVEVQVQFAAVATGLLMTASDFLIV